LKEYINDLKIVLFVLAAVVIAIIYNWNYFFSDETLNEVKVVQKQELEKGLDK
jgi:hypothetical protein